MKKLVLAVINGESTPCVPVWMMRQAGRYLPDYQKIRNKYTFLTLCLTPELAAEVTLQPVKILDVDAAIIFSDILIPSLSMGCVFDFREGKGPVFSSPVRNRKDIASLRTPSDGEEMMRVSEALRLVKESLPPEKTLIGFCASPFTLACYLIEGEASSTFYQVKNLLYNHPDDFHRLMDRLTRTLIEFLNRQAEAGADALQIFDTWGGILSPSDFKVFSWPYLKRLVSGFKAKHSQPLIYFMRSSGGFLQILKDLSVEVMGIDWTIDLTEASRQLEGRFVLQGNLDPVVLLAKKKVIKDRAIKILVEGRRLKGHIFNLGHGILPSTAVENARYLVEIVHTFG